MRVELIALNEGACNFETIVGDVPVRIGRHTDMDIRVADPWASRRHCELEQVSGTVWVRDLGSRHGVYVNGHAVDNAKLMPGDTLSVGLTSYRLNYERPSSVSAFLARLAATDSSRKSHSVVVSVA